MKQGRSCLAALLVLLLLVPALASAQALTRGFELRVLTGDDSPVTRDIVQALRRRHPALQASSDLKALASRRGAAVYVALGPTALRTAINGELDAPLVSLFTSSQAYLDLTGHSRSKRAQLTAIYAEAAPAHQIQLTARIFGRGVAVAALISEKTAHLIPLLRSAAVDAGVELEVQRVREAENPVRALSRLGPSAALLAFPDPTIYTPASLRDLLESTYRRNLPVIGFSSATVAAGTTATAYSTVDDVLAQLDDVLAAVASGHVPEPQFPRYWRVAINESVARSLNVIVTDEIRGLGMRPPETPR